MRHPAFTLVELLVVIAVIVVLLALLAPALDKAIYEAELATCGGNQHGVIAGTLTYAMGSRRAYPVRVAIEGGSNWSPTMIYNGSPEFRAYWSLLSQGLNVNTDTFDDRPVLREFMSLKSLVDPLTGKVDFEATDEDANAFSSIGLWFGFGIKFQQGLNRLGDRWTWYDKPNDRLWSFDVVVGDVAAYAGAVQSGHPDDAGVMANYTYQNTDFRGIPGFKTVTSVWEIVGEARWGLGLLDLNFAHDDGSVRRYNDVAYQDFDDARFGRPMFYNTIPGWQIIVPGR